MSIDRSFIITKEAWYADVKLVGSEVYKEDEIMIYIETPKVSGEFGIRWHLSVNAPRLEVFDDAWPLLPMCSDLLKEMAIIGDCNISPSAFGEMLKSLGFEDKTARVHPDSVAENQESIKRRKTGPAV